MDIDDFALSARLSEPYFLREVLGEELGDNSSIHKLLTIAVHAVLLESGFVGIDSVSGMQTDRFHLPDELASPFSLCYSLPELLRADYINSFGSSLTDYAVLKFLTLGQFLQVYGSLVKGTVLYKLSLDERRFSPALNLVWANCDKKDGSLISYTEKEVFEFWKIVKDGLALPLLIDLCSESGLALPACLIRLPAELKLKILESLPGSDVARIECVCSEMRYLACNNELWKQKFAEEFGDTSGAAGMGNWKKMFHSSRANRKKRIGDGGDYEVSSGVIPPYPQPLDHNGDGIPDLIVILEGRMMPRCWQLLLLDFMRVSGMTVYKLSYFGC
ncbi:hypothetical protein V6N11_072535 [Hibiscus sabdariffa]|uniref:F-box domain-containing protein n=2 Tax=Hibiscus sabdariffa TaxID=183260 RepID=A0ABR2U3B6_9ROSI